MSGINCILSRVIWSFSCSLRFFNRHNCNSSCNRSCVSSTITVSRSRCSTSSSVIRRSISSEGLMTILWHSPACNGNNTFQETVHCRARLICLQKVFLYRHINNFHFCCLSSLFLEPFHRNVKKIIKLSFTTGKSKRCPPYISVNFYFGIALIVILDNWIGIRHERIQN